MFLWCLVSAAAFVFTASIEKQIEPTLLCFGIFFVSALTFSLVQIKNSRSLFLKCKKQLSNCFMINITTFGCWFFSIYPLQFIDPSIAQSIVLATLPIATLSAGMLLYKNQHTGYLDYAVSILLFIGIFFISIIFLEGKIATHKFTTSNLIIALLCCIITGVSLAINNIYAKKLSDNKFSPFDILAIRFYLIVAITGFLSYDKLNQIFHMGAFINILITGFALIITPQIIFQYALKELEPITVSVISPLMPVLIFITEILTNKFVQSNLMLFAITYICLVSMIGAKIRYNYQRNLGAISKATASSGSPA